MPKNKPYKIINKPIYLQQQWGLQIKIFGSGWNIPFCGKLLKLPYLPDFSPLQ